VKARQHRGIPGERLRQKLERDRVFELEIVGPIDFAHPAIAEQTDDAIATGEDRPGQQAGLGRRRRSL
jgi:hypothetical protein